MRMKRIEETLKGVERALAADQFDIHPLAIIVLMVCIVALFFSIFWNAIGGSW